MSLNVGLASLTAFSIALASGTVFDVIGVDGATAVYLNVCGFQTKRIRPRAPLSMFAPTCSYEVLPAASSANR